MNVAVAFLRLCGRAEKLTASHRLCGGWIVADWRGMHGRIHKCSNILVILGVSNQKYFCFRWYLKPGDFLLVGTFLRQALFTSTLLKSDLFIAFNLCSSLVFIFKRSRFEGIVLYFTNFTLQCFWLKWLWITDCVPKTERIKYHFVIVEIVTLTSSLSVLYDQTTPVLFVASLLHKRSSRPIFNYHAIRANHLWCDPFKVTGILFVFLPLFTLMTWLAALLKSGGGFRGQFDRGSGMMNSCVTPGSLHIGSMLFCKKYEFSMYRFKTSFVAVETNPSGNGKDDSWKMV